MTHATVLILDDVPLNVTILQGMIRGLGDCETVGFTSAVEALEWCAETAPDLILLDYVMPEMDGAAFLTRLREIERCETVPALVVTTDQDRTILLKALDAGANDFIRKPVDQVEFHARVRNALRLGRALAQLRQMATTDALTGLLNRAAFLGRLAEEQDRAERYGHPCSVAMLDIDFFKRINDTYGHAAGDAALTAFASTCRDAVRKPDILGRLGGEEFGLIMPGTDRDGAHHATERIRAAVAAIRVAHGADRFAMTVSIGIGTYTTGSAMVDILARADTWLYRAKAEGRNRVLGGPLTLAA